jgi:hypothetical protein
MPAYKDPGLIEFDGAIQSAGGGGAFITFPFSVLELFGVKGRVPMVATFDGIEYRGSLVKMGGDCHLVPILKEIRAQIDKQPGDTVRVTLRLDTEPREVELADDIKAALEADAEAAQIFAKLAFTHQREYHRWIEDAKRPETRATRIFKMLEMLKAGQKPK